MSTKLGGSGSKNNKHGQIDLWLLLQGAGGLTIMSVTETRCPETNTTCFPQCPGIGRFLNLIVAYPLDGRLDISQMDMAEVKHSQWCRKEIELAQKDLVVATADETQPALRKKR